MSQEDELHRIAAEAAELAAKDALAQTFRLFGLDITDQDQVNAFRADLVHARRLRKLSDRIGIVMLWSVGGGVVAGALLMFWDGIKTALGK